MINQFSKKINIILYSILLLAILLGSFLIVESSNLLYFIQNILENKIFHRSFSLIKWADTIKALIAFPIFAVIVIDILLFPKYSDFFKLLHVLSFLVTSIILIVIASTLNSEAFMDSDMASELLLAKECYLQKTFFPRTWYYSTEIRILNTQIISAPLFIFTKNLKIIKIITVFFCSILLPLSLFYLLSSLNITKKWLLWLGCLLTSVPFSLTMWNYVNFGNYYIPHFCLAFIYSGLFLNLFYGENQLKKQKKLLSIFLILSFISGVSGIRYILYFIIPLFFTQIFYFLNTNKELSKFTFKSIIVENKNNFYTFLSVIISILGYLFNNLILSRLFTFSSYNTTEFTHIGDVTFTDIHSFLLKFFGYKDFVSVFTPSGIINVLLYVFYACLFILFIKELKKKEWNLQKYFLTYVFIISIFNGFIIINTEYQERYLALFLIFIIPSVIIIYNSSQHKILKYLLLSSFSISLLTSSFITIGSVISSEQNSDKKEVTEFLINNNYEFGYGTFWNANVFTYLSNDKLKIGNLYKHNENGVAIINDTYKYDKWLTPSSYYSNKFDNGKKVFLIVQPKQIEATPNANIFKNGKLVFKNEFYEVFEYKDNETFKNSF